MTVTVWPGRENLQSFSALWRFEQGQEAIQKVAAAGMTILIADQNLKFARRLADYAYIVENGIIRHEGAMEELLADGETVRKYLAV